MEIKGFIIKSWTNLSGVNMTSLKKTLEELEYTTRKIHGYLPAPAAKAYLDLIRFAESELAIHNDINIETGERHEFGTSDSTGT